ncbi:hypothetical protein [Actinomycetospora sp. CA-053990]|uniref:hypothetical protein n=1 Tax=Actinomycetospora sp. CA-053990 TaxID=3239891 RepID=UPI003D8EF8AE
MDGPVDPPAGPGADPAVVLGEGVLALLTELHGDGGAVLVLDDLHWADADTLDLLHYLAGTVDAGPVLLALAARDDEDHHGVAALAAHPDVTVVALDRLGAEAVAALAGTRASPPRDLGDLLARSEGLPFLVEELLDAGPGAVPPSWAGLVARRLGALPDGARAVVDAAAVAPGDPDHRLLAAATGVDEAGVLAALRAAVAAGLLAAADGRLAWRHALTRDAVLAALLPPDRAAVAGRLAAALEARASPATGRRRPRASPRPATTGGRRPCWSTSRAATPPGAPWATPRNCSCGPGSWARSPVAWPPSGCGCSDCAAGRPRR